MTCIDLRDVFHLEDQLPVTVVGKNLIKKVNAPIVIENQITDVTSRLRATLGLCKIKVRVQESRHQVGACLLYTSDAADERSSVDLGGRRIIKKKNSTKNHIQQKGDAKNIIKKTERVKV